MQTRQICLTKAESGAKHIRPGDERVCVVNHYVTYNKKTFSQYVLKTHQERASQPSECS